MRLIAASSAWALVLALTIGGTPGLAGQQSDQHGGAIYTPDEVKWKPGPPSLPKGAEFVVLEGDPASDGKYFALRLRLPDGYRIPPHWHPVAERVTVISGIFRLGHGDKFDENGTRALKAGSYFTLPPQSRHFARAEGETIVQLNSVGPWQIRYVDPNDDPRERGTGD